MDPETMDTPATPADRRRRRSSPGRRSRSRPPEPARARWSRRVLALVAGGALVALTVGASAVMASDPAAAPAGGAIPVDAAAADAAFKDFAACMRKNGIDMPDPVTVTGGPTTASGGPVHRDRGPDHRRDRASRHDRRAESGTSIVVGSGDAQAVPVDDATFKAANDACSPILEAAGINSGTGTIVSGEGTLSAGGAGTGVIGSWRGRAT